MESMENINLDSIMSGDEIASLFTEAENTEQQESSPEIEEANTEETTEVDVENLFGGKPESVGSEESSSKGGEDFPELQGSGTSPKNNFYSSIAKALKEDGIFPDLDDNSINEAKTPEDFAKLVRAQIASGLDETQKRVNEALNAGVEPSRIKQFERTLSYYNSIKSTDIEDESEQGITLRKQLIYQDLLNKGFSKERAAKEVQKSFDAQTDIEDALDAYREGKDFFKKGYDNLVKEARALDEEERKRIDEETESLRKSILDDKKAFGVLDVDKATRQRVFDTITKPVYKDPDTGELFTTLQKYEKDNHNEFMKNVGLLYTLTDGFKSIDSLVNREVRKKVSKGIRDLEHTLSGTQRDSGGNLRFATGVDDDVESYSGKGWDIDI